MTNDFALRLEEQIDQCESEQDFQDFYEKYKALYTIEYDPYSDEWTESHGDVWGFGSLFRCLSWATHLEDFNAHEVFQQCLSEGHCSGGSHSNGTEWDIDFGIYDPESYLWTFQCAGSCKSQIPIIKGSSVDLCFLQLEEFNISPGYVNEEKTYQVVDFTHSHSDNSGAHICQWSITREDMEDS